MAGAEGKKRKRDRDGKKSKKTARRKKDRSRKKKDRSRRKRCELSESSSSMDEEQAAEMANFWDDLEERCARAQGLTAAAPGDAQGDAAAAGDAQDDEQGNVQSDAQGGAQGNADGDAQDDASKKQAVEQWLRELQAHDVKTGQCSRYGRSTKNKWCISGEVPRNVLTVIGMYKKTSTITKSGVDAVAKFMES
eukprot:TRINITY_DN102772_c0_g1_i1.p1 TRINITY_DN102772_c0_g1~~TRINITY_DN102772_c0_g1_i1.p1  ORF type:complete len:193 (+),score=51.89 TRINITY_DN102772_c0_g1_i1:42-620(+)